MLELLRHSDRTRRVVVVSCDSDGVLCVWWSHAAVAVVLLPFTLYYTQY